MTTATMDAQTSPGLARRLGLATATALVVGEVIGVGIFLTPAEMARSLGSPFWLLAVWLIDGRRDDRRRALLWRRWRLVTRRPAVSTSI